MKIHIHLGAHKTATTFLQRTLNARVDELGQARIGFAPISRVRKEFSDALTICDMSGPLLRPLMTRFLRGRFDRLVGDEARFDHFILSDENLAGPLALNAMMGALYPRIGPRAGYLQSILSGHDTHYFFAIRRYQDYLRSSWLQMAAKGRAPAFERYLAKFPPAGPDWTTAIAALARACGPERVSVWTYDWFRRDPARAFSLLVPGLELSIPEVELRRDVLPSLTVKGLKAMKALEPLLSKDEYSRMVRLVRNFAFDEPNPGLEIADPGLRAAYDAKFAGDLDAIAALGVRLHR